MWDKRAVAAGMRQRLEALRRSAVACLRMRFFPARRARLCIAFVLCCTAVLQFLPQAGGASRSDGRQPALPAPQQEPSWLPIDNPPKLYALDTPEFAESQSGYEAIRARRGAGREDHLSFGAVDRPDAPFMHVFVYRVGGEAVEPMPFFVDLVRRATAAGLAVAKTRPGDLAQTKFGDMETAGMQLAVNGAVRSCLAFRRAVAGENLRIAGWYCSATDASIFARDAVPCLIDRLALVDADGDVRLQEGFAAVEKRHLACGGPSFISASAAEPPMLQEQAPPRPRNARKRR
jgi:hypothetical protein